MTDSLLRDPLIGELLTRPGRAEEALLWTDPELGVNCRCKPDWLTDDGWVLDLKSARTANPRRFRWQAWDLGYDIQAWFYLRGIEQALGVRPQGFVFATCEKSRPWVCVPYLATEQLLQRGRGRAELAVAQLLEARRTGIWPGYAEPGKLVDLDPPTPADKPIPEDLSIDLY